MWRPDIVLLNAVGEPDDVKTWYTTSAANPGGQPPTLYLHMRVRGQFKESLELRDFPVDMQVGANEIAFVFMYICNDSLSTISLRYSLGLYM